MVFRRAHSSFLIALLAIYISGCGGGNSVSFPPPQGGFTNANLSGTYAYSFSGSDGAGFLAAAGSFQADGNGHVTAGTQDVNSGIAVTTNVATTGTYLVRADGRGTINLTATSGNMTLDFVLVAGNHGLITRFDSNAAASGTLDLQNSSAFSNAALAGTFAVSLSGVDSVNNPAAGVANFTMDNAGNITSGIDDFNDNGVIITNHPLTGSLPVAANGRGTATLTTGVGTFNFSYYVVDANTFKIVETDTGAALSGDAFRQQGPFSNTSVSGAFAFTVAGADVVNGGPFAAGGVLTSDGAGNVTGGTEDVNDIGGLSTNLPLSGTYAVAATGRGTLVLSTSAGNFNFVVYPTTNGVLALEVDPRFVVGGTAFQQTIATFAASSLQGGYGLNFTGQSGASGELDSIAQFAADGVSKVTGIIDQNNRGGITFGQPLNGTYSAAGNGRTTLALQTPAGTQNMVVYMIGNTRALFIEADPNIVAVGELRHQ